MNPNLLLLLFVCLLFMSFFSASAQTKVSGQVVDGSDNGKLEKASIALLNAKDSILVRFTWSKENGGFSLTNLDTGSYKLLVSYPQYADFAQDLVLDAEGKELGIIKLSKVALLIEEVQVMGRMPVVIKGDTIEYDAASFKVEKDAKVEDLLKVLPGITMDASGRITAQGKEVKKVLLDGEEFFGDDPTLITKNIRSDMVSKVQVYEKKSDLAVRTGIDDGERTQTIDIKLKEDKKKGMFGQASGGVGTDKYYAGKVMANRFKGTQKIAAYGIVANDGLVGLGFEDGQKYGVGGNTNVTVMDGGGIMITSDGGFDGTDSWSGNYRGAGVPKALNMGFSFSDKSKNDKHKLNVSYKRNQMDVRNNSTYQAQESYPENPTLDNASTRTDNQDKSHNINMRYDFNIDSLSSGTVRLGYSRKNQENNEDKETDRRSLEGHLINETENLSNAVNSNENLNLDFLLTRKFKKDKRSMTLNANIRSNQTDGKTNYYSLANYYSTGTKTEIDQFKRDEVGSKVFTTSLNYTEPLSKNLTATLGYSFQKNNATNLNQSFDKDPATGDYTLLDLQVLNDFRVNSSKNTANTGLNFKNDLWTINVSNRLDFEDVSRTYNNLNTQLQRSQTSVNPMFYLGYKLSKSKNISFRYYGRTVQPDLTQIEPLKQNANQLVNYLDNPDLSAGFSNSYSLDFNSYRPLKDRSLYLYGGANQSINSINSRVRYYSETGKRDISFVNIDKQNWSAHMGGGYRMPLFRKIGVNINTGLSANFNSTYNYLSTGQEEPELNNTERFSFGPSLGVSRYRANKMDFSVDFRPGVQVLNSSLQSELNSTTFTLSSNSNLTYYFPKDFKISVNMDQSYQGATETLKAFSTFNMTGYISKKFLKDKSLEAQVFVNDILNKNNGISRYQNGYSFVQTSNDVLKRYGMFKLIYNFTTMKGGN
ncbi:Outer membrane receptor proteins, mostly Fe transport [Sphingobacterium nematocida]|uniref:Outer membrane receptor proteins, mostly Fe transport n=1 Tax=Sphingobacterium nematocida TaxID=1513896 RepID=A0A1T5F9Q0_9SPHI|nr:TonB-dependent receptor [Sphingobacterium nematocida]SKB92876.1 Outer membrane receptor proteins, mostly Fe transport [Sphingobacterium nematocida]